MRDTTKAGFTSYEYRRQGRHRVYRAAPKRRTYKKSGSAGMLMKMAICAMLCAAVLISESRAGERLMEVTANIAEKAEDVGGEYLGKLRFVELPGIIEVFSSDARLSIGAEYDGYELSDDKTTMMVYGLDGKLLLCPSECTVKSVSDGIELYLDGDILIRYRGIADTLVEEGQPLKKGDNLCTGRDPIEISLYKGGKPQDPTEYFDMTRLLST